MIVRNDLLTLSHTSDITGVDYTSDAVPVRRDSLRENRAKKHPLTDTEIDIRIHSELS